MAEEDEATARRRRGRAQDSRLRGGRRRIDGDGDRARDGRRRAAGGRRAGRGEQAARRGRGGRRGAAGEQRGKRRSWSWSSHLPVAMGWVANSDMGCLLQEGGRNRERIGDVARLLVVSTSRSCALDYAIFLTLSINMLRREMLHVQNDLIPMIIRNKLSN